MAAQVGTGGLEYGTGRLVSLRTTESSTNTRVISRVYEGVFECENISWMV